MKIESTSDGNKVTLSPEGRIDTVTAPELEEAAAELPQDVSELVFDLSKVEYVSSAGLRVIIGAQKRMAANGGKMSVANLAPAVMEVFEITGLAGVLHIF